MSDIACKKAADLTRDEREAWDSLQASDPQLFSPYFSLGYLDAVASVRSDVRVIICRDAGEPVSFLPVQRGMFGHARPLGGPLSDHHGIVGRDPGDEGLRAMLSAAGVGVLDFHGALGRQRSFYDGAVSIDGSWVVDLSHGYDVWLTARKKPGGNTLRTILVSERKMTERHGPFEYNFDDRREDALEALYRWKAEQYRSSGHFDVFSADWTRPLVRALLDTPKSQPGHGVVSTLRVTGKVAAVHFGMIGRGVMHYWFPAYDPAFQKEGSGNALLMQILKSAEHEGLKELHLGPGDYRYKAALANWQFPLVRGFAGSGPAALVRAAAASLENTSEALPLGRVARWPGKAFRRIDQMAGFRAA